jgi:hypothetical protein
LGRCFRIFCNIFGTDIDFCGITKLLATVLLLLLLFLLGLDLDLRTLACSEESHHTATLPFAADRRCHRFRDDRRWRFVMDGDGRRWRFVMDGDDRRRRRLHVLHDSWCSVLHNDWSGLLMVDNDGRALLNMLNSNGRSWDHMVDDCRGRFVMDNRRLWRCRVDDDAMRHMRAWAIAAIGTGNTVISRLKK